MDVREKLVELIASKECDYYSGVYETWVEHDCEKCGAENCSVAQLADHLIANGVTVQEWIPASEPPKDTYEYWIAYKAGGDYFYSTGYFDGKCWRSAITHKQIPVTHWTFLPQPPKGE